MDLVLHRVDGRNRLNLDGVVAPGVEFYTAEVEETDDDHIPTGRIILSPVKVATTAVKRTAEAEPDA